MVPLKLKVNTQQCKKLFLSGILWLLFSYAGMAQYVYGVVKDAKTGEPLALSSVYFSGTTLQTASLQNGQFKLKSISGLPLDLVISHVGYYNQRIAIQQKNDSLFFEVLLQENTELLAQFNKVADDPNRPKYLRYFNDGCIGTSKVADKCKILNPYVIKFKATGREGSLNWELYAYSDSAIEISNPKLGYLVKFQLEFYHMTTTQITYFGYPLFVDQLDSSKIIQIKSARQTAYKGSKQHFFTALYNRKLNEEGFLVHQTQSVPKYMYNFELESLLDALSDDDSLNILQTEMPLDIYRYIDNTLNEPYQLLKYPYPFEVMYTNEKSGSRYRSEPKYSFGMEPRNGMQSSVVKIKNGTLAFYPNGSVASEYEFITVGYWSFEKIGDRMPSDYNPE